MTRPLVNLAFCSAIGVVLVACTSTDRVRARSDGSKTQSALTQQANPSTPADSTPIGTAAAYLARHRYQRWAPLAADDSIQLACAAGDGDAAEGVEVNALWGIARARVLQVQQSASDSTNVNVSAEVLRVLSVEGDPATSDGDYAKADMVIAQPVVDTLWMSLRRAATGWAPCGFVWFLQDEVMSPIALTGPPADTTRPRGLPVSRWVPRKIDWTRLRAIADSVAEQ